MRNAVSTSATIRGLEVVFWLHTDEDPNPASWANGIATTLAIKKKVGDLARFRSLVVSDGGAPNASQRKELFETVFDRRPHKLAVITDSLTNPLKRGVATAISWLNPEFKAVTSDRFREALRHVDLDGALVEVLAVFRGLQPEIAPVKTLAELERLATLLG